MIRVIRAADMKEGRWLNGLGLSWDIAADPPGAGAADFGWRFAIARIDADVPFSHYQGVDRVFTLIAGRGLVLTVEGIGEIDVGELYVPHRFPGDAVTSCRLKDGPCRALNLFLAREKWSADVDIRQGANAADHIGPVLLYAMDGPVSCGGQNLQQGDAAVVSGNIPVESGFAHHYMARLTKL